MEDVYVVAGVIINERKILLVKRAVTPVRYYWNVPGGRIEPNESPKDAVAREIKEELGIDVEVESLCYESENPEEDKRYHLKAYYCKPEGELKPRINKKEIIEWKLFSIKEAKNVKLTDHVRNILLPKMISENMLD